MMIYKEAFLYGEQSLKDCQISEATLDARLLLEWVCKTDRNTLLVHSERPLSEEEEATYKNLIQKRKQHIPLQHLTNEQDFMGLTFIVSNKVLIPRQDTEILVEEVMKSGLDGMRILDVCTGSGCILLSLLKYSNHTSGTGVDLSEEALEIAKKNSDKLGIDAEWILSDLFCGVSGTYDIIVSNPPYIEASVIPNLMEEVRDYEPLMALDGGADGLDFYRRIVKESVAYINPHGKLYFEIGYQQAKSVILLMQEFGYRDITVVKDYAGLDRVVYGTYQKNGEE